MAEEVSASSAHRELLARAIVVTELRRRNGSTGPDLMAAYDHLKSLCAAGWATIDALLSTAEAIDGDLQQRIARELLASGLHADDEVVGAARQVLDLATPRREPRKKSHEQPTLGFGTPAARRGARSKARQSSSEHRNELISQVKTLGEWKELHVAYQQVSIKLMGLRVGVVPGTWELAQSVLKVDWQLDCSPLIRGCLDFRGLMVREDSVVRTRFREDPIYEFWSSMRRHQAKMDRLVGRCRTGTDVENRFDDLDTTLRTLQMSCDQLLKILDFEMKVTINRLAENIQGPSRGA